MDWQYIETYNHNNSFKVGRYKFPFGNFENLIDLELKNCSYEGYDQEALTHFTKISLKYLENFFFESKYPIYLESFVGLIRNSGKNLKSLTLHGCQIEDPENAQNILII